LSDHGAEVASADVGDPRIESEPAVIAPEGEAVSTGSHAAGENDPAA
jgi:hypothetical protein